MVLRAIAARPENFDASHVSKNTRRMKQNARRLHAVVHNVAAAPAVINGSCASFAAGIPKGRACAPVLFERRRVRRNPFPLVRGLPLAPRKMRGNRAHSISGLPEIEHV